MKTNKLLSLDYELVLKLKKESNASRLINSLLVKHYASTDNPYLEMTKEEREKEKAILLIQQDADNKMMELENEHKG